MPHACIGDLSNAYAQIFELVTMYRCRIKFEEFRMKWYQVWKWKESLDIPIFLAYVAPGKIHGKSFRWCILACILN